MKINNFRKEMKFLSNLEFSKIEKAYDCLEEFTRNFNFVQKRGRPHHDFAKVISAFMYYLKTGCSLRSIPRLYGHYSTLYGCFKRL